MPEAVEPVELSEDEQHLARLGYSQELNRTWSSFSNFAISFSIISILAGCFTTFGQAWNNGGPVAISWGWPIISAFILLIGFTLSELVSAYPTSGGIYWWASKMGGPAAGFFTGWLNLIGLLAVTASVAYGAATFLDLTLSTISDGYAGGYSLTRVFLWFVVILVLAALANIFSGHLLAIINNISVWWHVAGAAVVILVLFLVPDSHQSASFVFTERINNSGFSSGAYWFLVLPLGFLLTQYTITGFDASAHLSEETQGAADGAAKGIWRSIFYSAVGGYLLLLAFLFAVQDADKVTEGRRRRRPDLRAGAAHRLALPGAADLHGRAALLHDGVPDQRLADDLRVQPRRRDPRVVVALQGARQTRIPANAVIFVAVVGILITLPALIQVDINGAPVPVAFYAVVSVAVIGLYLAFLIPIFLRWRLGRRSCPARGRSARSTSG